jgi:ABC-2 type transport system permease protein
MPTLVRTELLAMRTIRTTWTLVAAAAILTAALAVNPVLDAGTAGAPSIGTAGALLDVLSAAGPGRLVVLLIGVFAVTAEFRHGTGTARFLQSPRRSHVLAAKGVATALAAAAVAVVDLAVVLTVGLGTGAVQLPVLNGDIVRYAVGLLLAYPLYGLLGVGVGALITYQPVAVLLPLVWLVFLEPRILHFLPRAVTPWSAAGVTAALSNSGTFTDVLPVAVGAVALSCYALSLLSLGALRLTRRDIT